MWLASTLAAFLLTAGSVQAQSVGEKIESLEQELQQLKESQIELKKEATAAAAAMPSFSYRPGNGLMIEAADKSWSLRHSVETHFRYDFQQGRDQVGRTRGELQGRRFRPEFYFCIDNCLWQVDWRLDLDGFGGKTDLQRGAIFFQGGNINPWLPTVQFGMDTTNAGPASRSRQGSGATGSQAEYDLFTRNHGFNTGSASYGMSMIWDDKPLNSIGIPGRISRLQIGMNTYGEGGDGIQVNSDRKDFTAYLSVEPFSQVKNKWLRGFLFEYGAWFCNSDNRANVSEGNSNGCSRSRIQSHPAGGQTLYDTGANSVGDGLAVQHGPGVLWNIGPYTLRMMRVWQNYGDDGTGFNGSAASGRGRKKGSVFLIGHDLFLWSPKGWLTGSPTTAGSVLVGTHFERSDVSRGCAGSTGIACGATGHMGEFHRNRILVREWDLWYFIAPRMSVGGSLLWYDASNLRTGNNQAAHNLDVCSNRGACRPGTGGDWVDFNLNWRYQF